MGGLRIHLLGAFEIEGVDHHELGSRKARTGEPGHGDQAIRVLQRVGQLAVEAHVPRRRPPADQAGGVIDGPFDGARRLVGEAAATTAPSSTTTRAASRTAVTSSGT